MRLTKNGKVQTRMIKEILLEAKNTNPEAKDAFDAMFKDSMDTLKEIDKMIDKAIKNKDHKKLDSIAKDLAKIKK